MVTKAKKTRRPYRSLADATEAAVSASRERDVLHLALLDVVGGKVEWLEESHEPSEREPEAFTCRVGLSRLTSPHGGIAIVSLVTPGASPYLSAFYLDEWAERAIRDRNYTDGPNARVNDILARRALEKRRGAYDAEED